MKYFVILLVIVGFISIANAQYAGNVEFYHKSVNTGFDQHSVLMQSESTKFTKAMFDRPAEALIFSISTSSDVIDTATITMNKQTMSQLFSGLEDDPSNMVLLINGEVKPYRIIADNKMVSWMFYVPTESTQVELIPPTSMFEPVKSSEDIPFNVLRIYPPVKQNHVGVSYEDIKCKENLVLLQKYDGSPACVTEPTKTKLVERGWTVNNKLNDSDFDNIKSNIENLGYDICSIRIADNTIVVDLNKIFEGTKQEKQIISQVPPHTGYDIVYHDGYTDYFINTMTSHKCE